eukprot:2406411-Karenia_brevis.AAC.1
MSDSLAPEVPGSSTGTYAPSGGHSRSAAGARPAPQERNVGAETPKLPIRILPCYPMCSYQG